MEQFALADWQNSIRQCVAMLSRDCWPGRGRGGGDAYGRAALHCSPKGHVGLVLNRTAQNSGTNWAKNTLAPNPNGKEESGRPRRTAWNREQRTSTRTLTHSQCRTEEPNWEL